MKFRCPCGEKEMNIADEKLPASGVMRFPCPVCKKAIVLDPANAPAPARFEDAPPAASPGVPAAAPPGVAPAPVAAARPGAEGAWSVAQEGPPLEPEMIPHGVKAALVAVSDPRWQQAAAAFFRDRGYYLLEETGPSMAVRKLLINAVDAALVEGSAPWQPVVTEIIRRPGLKRRETCLMVLGEAKSLDSYAAFLLGADWVVNQGDIERAGEVLGEILARQEASREPWVQAEPT